VDTSLLGTLLRDRRRRAGLTQAQAAAAAQLSVRALREIEQGRVARPHPASLRRLATALHLGGADTDRLLAGVRASDPRHVDAVTVNVLGPLAVARRGAPVVIASIARQRLLGLLALESDRYVSVGEIADVIWGERLPGQWRNRVHAHVGQLRQLLEPGRPRRASSVVLPHHSDGYRLSLPEDCLDASRFRRHLAAAGEAALLPDPLSAARHYEEALSCWRGPILDGTDGALAVRPAAEALHRARVAGTLAFADLAATLGAHDRATLWLQAVAGEEPMHEGVQSRLMRALAHQGQQERALLLYGELRARLAEELGVDPAPETQAAYGEVLRMGSAGPVPQRADIPIPAQLPMATPFFAGRDEAVDRIAGHLTGPGRAAEIPAPRIVLIHGMPGIGKTALALQVAHRIRKHYPEGQLFADLRGEAESPAPADQILGGLLRSLGVAPGDIPADLDERSALLRSHLAGRRVLMVLDDARCGDQVVALLPSDRGNDVLITSRHPLHELPVTRRRLDPLDLDDSLSLLARYVPAQRLAAESPAASKVAAACAGLPLALTIAGALAHSGDSLDDIAEALAEPGLPGIRAGELGLRRSLDSACRGLSPVARTALRRLAALPTRSFAPWAVQAILDTDEGTAAEVLHEVINANLVSRSSAGPARARQHALHDLVRLHLRGLAAPEDAEAVDRAIRTWLHLADAAMRRLAHRILPLDELGLVAPQPLPPAVVGDPYAWFDGELGNLLDALDHTARRGQPRVAAGLLTALTPYLRVRQHTDVWRWATDVVIAGAQEAGDEVAWAYACESLVRLSFVTSELSASVTYRREGTRALHTGGLCAGSRRDALPPAIRQAPFGRRPGRHADLHGTRCRTGGNGRHRLPGGGASRAGRHPPRLPA
jgi:DNA-binding SARP family transcriptional activator/DNA-binding XRE family transcriptional regulator